MSTVPRHLRSHPKPALAFGPDFIPPLENGDNLDAQEFERRWENMPELRKAELIEGIVYLECDLDPEDLETIDPTIPPLENGDNLEAEEFERRWENMPNLKKAELIDGIVYMGSPVTSEFHADQDSLIATWLGVYRAYTPGVKPAGNATVKLGFKNWPQPDQYLRIAEGGSTHIDAKGYVVGPPELAVEISATSVNKDVNQKKKSFQKSGVKEYIVWRVYENAIDWYFLKGGKYLQRRPDAASVLKSRVFPGLWLDVPAILAHDIATVLKRLKKGLATKEHHDFVALLASRASS